MAEQAKKDMFDIFDKMSGGVIKTVNNTTSDGDWQSEFSDNENRDTPINAANLNIMLDLTRSIKELLVGGDKGITEFDTRLQGEDLKINNPYSVSAESAVYTLAAYLKAAFDRIQGGGEVENTDWPSLQGLKNRIGVLNQIDIKDSVAVLDTIVSALNEESSRRHDQIICINTELNNELNRAQAAESDLEEKITASIQALASEATNESASKTISKITLTDGKITELATQDISITHNQVSDFSTSVQGMLADKADSSNVYTKTEVDNKIKSASIDHITDSNVTLSAPFILTKDFGYYTLDGASFKEVGIEGQTLRSFLEGAFSQVDNNVLAESPSYSVTITGNTSAEIGEKVTPTYKASGTPGSYKWGTLGADNKADFNNKSTGISYGTSSYTATSGTLGGTITYEEDPQTLSLTASALRRAATNTPVNNLGETVSIPDSINSDKTVTATASKTFTGYREGCFYGTVSTANFTSDMITSAVVRGLQKKTGKNYASATNLAYTVPVGATAILIAVPAGKTGPTSVLNTTVNAEMWGDNFKQVTVEVGGADATANSVGSYKADYDVYYYIPANAYGSTADLQIDLSA